jgi:glycosyltransferase involved in cell wall biosynthesis
VLRGAARVLTVSDEVADGVLAMGVDPDRVDVVGTGVDTEVFTPDGPRLETDGPTAVYAGTMSEIQGASVFVEAMGEVVAKLPDARLVMLGQGSEAPALRRLAARLPAGTVELPGVMDGARTARWLRSARVGLASVRPGRGYDVAFATKTFASTASGSPVVYAGVGPCRVIVADNDLGRSVPWEPSAVAAAMVELLEREPEPAERARLVQWTREHYSLATVAARAAQAVADVARRGDEPRA